MRKQIIALTAAAILLPSIALADHGDRDGDNDRHKDKSAASQFNYNGPVDLTPISAVKKIRFGDEDVIVEGKIVRQLANGDFMFTDGSDEIVVEMEHVKLDETINENTTLRLFGEYEGWDKKLEVERVQVVKGK